MISGAQTKEGSFVKVGWGFHGILVCSRVFLLSRWTMLEKVFGVGAVRRWFYLAAKPPHVRVGVDGLACPPAPSYDMQPSDEGTWPSARCHLILLLQWAVAPPGGCEAPQAWIFDGVLTVRVLNTGRPWGRLPGARACPKLGYEVGS
jgi:hypothetical protein